LIPVTTNGYGEFFAKCYPGSRPANIEMGNPPKANSALFFISTNEFLNTATVQNFDLADIGLY